MHSLGPHPPPGYGGPGDPRWVGSPPPPPRFGPHDLLAFGRAVSGLRGAEDALARHVGSGDGLVVALHGVATLLRDLLRDFATHPEHAAVARRTHEDAAARDALEKARPLEALIAAAAEDAARPVPGPLAPTPDRGRPRATPCDRLRPARPRRPRLAGP